jgi:uncharacterized LabA/DUF88 family protein
MHEIEMNANSPKVAVFIDYDNLTELHKMSKILDVVTKALLQSEIDSKGGNGSCSIRIYGGWFEGTLMTKLAQDLSVAIQNDFPTIVRIPQSGQGIIPLVTTAELAVSMLEDPTQHLFGTYRKKGKPNNVRVQKPENVGCSDASCLLPNLRKMLKSGHCPISTCAVMSQELVYRHEQKMVDTMLTCDMIYAQKSSFSHIILISGDDDFFPPVQTILLRGTPVVRFHTRPGRMRAITPRFGAKLIEMVL